MVRPNGAGHDGAAPPLIVPRPALLSTRTATRLALEASAVLHERVYRGARTALGFVASNRRLGGIARDLQCQRESTIWGQRGPGDVTALIGAEEDDGLRDLFWPTSSS